MWTCKVPERGLGRLSLRRQLQEQGSSPSQVEIRDSQGGLCGGGGGGRRRRRIRQVYRAGHEPKPAGVCAAPHVSVCRRGPETNPPTFPGLSRDFPARWGAPIFSRGGGPEFSK